MEEPIERRSNRSRKLIVPFDECITQFLGPSKPKTPVKPTKPTEKSTTKPSTQLPTPTTHATAPPTKSSIKPKPSVEPKASIEPKRPTKSSTKLFTKPSTKSPTKPPTLDPIEELCSQTEALDIKAKKEAKAKEIARLANLGLKGVIEEAKLPKDVVFEPFDPS
jgi:hypothetical protein